MTTFFFVAIVSKHQYTYSNFQKYLFYENNTRKTADRKIGNEMWYLTIDDRVLQNQTLH